jgi:hypothetical protein
MRRNYDIFERFPDGSSLWQACVRGQFDTRRKIHELAEHSKNEFFVIDLTLHERIPTLRPRKLEEQNAYGNKRSPESLDSLRRGLHGT